MRTTPPTRDRWWLPSWRGAVVLLLLGLVINLGVAVAIARWGKSPSGQGLVAVFGDDCVVDRFQPRYKQNVLPLPSVWPGPVPRHWGESPHAILDRELREGQTDVELLSEAPWSGKWTQRSAMGWSTDLIAIGNSVQHFGYEVNRIGFPLATLRFDRQWPDITHPMFMPPLQSVGRLWYDGHRVPSDYPPPASMMYPKWVLPVMPVWRGMICNTALYFAVSWGLATPVTYARRHLRLRRGECVRCRYPIVPGKAVCPECGSAVVMSNDGATDTTIQPSGEPDAA